MDHLDLLADLIEAEARWFELDQESDTTASDADVLHHACGMLGMTEPFGLGRDTAMRAVRRGRTEGRRSRRLLND